MKLIATALAICIVGWLVGINLINSGITISEEVSLVGYFTDDGTFIITRIERGIYESAR